MKSCILLEFKGYKRFWFCLFDYFRKQNFVKVLTIDECVVLLNFGLIMVFGFYLRDRLQVSLLVLTEFKRINIFYRLWNH